MAKVQPSIRRSSAWVTSRASASGSANARALRQQVVAGLDVAGVAEVSARAARIAARAGSRPPSRRARIVVRRRRARDLDLDRQRSHFERAYRRTKTP